MEAFSKIMNESEYNSIVAAYQQKAFELFNQNVVYQAQIASLQKQVSDLVAQLQNTSSQENQEHQEHQEHHHG